MKITDVKVETIRIPMKKPFRIAFAVQDHSLNVLVKISTDEGLWGIGEAAPFEPVTGESAATVLEALKLFRTGLIGMDPLDVEGIHRMMDRLLSGNTSAKAAVDIALYDIKGKLMGQPLYKVLGGSVNQIVTDMTVGIDTPEAMAAEARERVEKDGFTILKIKAGINPTEDIQALTLIRQAVGPNIRLRVDANQGYTVSDAVRTLKAFEELGVEAVEQCLPSWDLDGMRFVRSKVDLQVMLDESVHTPIDAAKACKIDAADIINIKLMKCGGLYPAEKINAIADYTREELRQDLLCYTSSVLKENLVLTGDMTAELYVSSDAPDTDFVVRVTDVDENGRSIKLADGLLSARYRNGFARSEFLQEGEIVCLKIRTTKLSNCFRKGHRIRVTVTSSAKNFIFPNSNTREGFASARTVVAHNRVYHGGLHASRLTVRVEP